MTYYNTTKLEGEDLEEAFLSAKKQDEKILALFRLEDSIGCNTKFTPSEVYEMTSAMHWPITSIRRSINTLSKNTYEVECSFYARRFAGVRN